MTLRPFFCFYGGKWRDTPRHYPAPRYDHIIEPFAGSAGYSLRYPDRQVTLYDLDPVIVGVWSYLLRVSVAEILALPDVPMDGTVEAVGGCQEARWLAGFWLNKGVSGPRSAPSAWMKQGHRPGAFWGPRVRQTIASQLEAIRHWKIVPGSYQDAPPLNATWFVDPPYQGAAGQHYRCGSKTIDYQHLGGAGPGRGR